MGGGKEVADVRLEYTPTWIVAVICSGVVFLSLAISRLLHFLGKLLQRKKQKALFEALQKVKEELMVLGFISLLLVVFQGAIRKVCIPESFVTHMLPCKYEHEVGKVAHVEYVGVRGGGRRLFASGDSGSKCKKGKVPVLSLAAIHEMHIFISVLALTHVILSALTYFFGGLKMRQWKHWEDSIQNRVRVIVSPSNKILSAVLMYIPHGIAKDSSILGWLHSFLKQFYGPVTRSDYIAMRHYFIMTHCKGNQKFDFHKYMVRALESDFKKVVGLSWYLWIFVIIFLLLNVHGWDAYFWISFIPVIILLAVGTKLEHIITQSANEIIDQQSTIEGGLQVKPSDDYFWFHKPRILLFLIHFILFQNSFEIAVFFWILITYGFHSCIMGKVGLLVPRLVIKFQWQICSPDVWKRIFRILENKFGPAVAAIIIIQILCSYSTLPLYAFVAQTANSIKGFIFEEHLQESFAGWSQNVHKRRSTRICDEDSMLTAESENCCIQNTIEVENISTEDCIENKMQSENTSDTGEEVITDKDSQKEKIDKN